MKLCPRCREVAETSPCPRCRRRANRARGSAAARGYDAAWVALAARAIAAQPWCTACKATEDLTVDHRIPLAAGGPRHGLTLADVQVLCRSCNSAKGARLPEAPTQEPPRGPQDHWGGGEPITLLARPEPPTPPARPSQRSSRSATRRVADLDRADTSAHVSGSARDDGGAE